MAVKLILRDKEYEVKPGMTLLDSLKKINVLSESVIATLEGEMILDDEILRDGDVIKLISVISGGSGFENRYSIIVDRILSADTISRISNSGSFS